MQPTALGDLRSALEAALVGRFVLGDAIGSGGFAAVFRARDPVLKRDVAIKVLDPARVRGVDADALLEEARIVAGTEHPHIVPLYEAGRRDQLAWLVMRYFPEGSLSARLDRGPAFTPREVAGIGREVAEALEVAHGRGVVHLDIKPDNILLDAAGHAAVTDFGIARFMRSGSGEGAAVSGTPHYMSPEQVAGDVVDGRSDVYSLGVVLYELATGNRPITGNSSSEIMANQVRQDPAPLRTASPELPTALAEVIHRALAKDPAARWPSARAMADGLRAVAMADRMLAPREVRRRVRRRWYRRGIVVIASVALVLVAIGVSLLGVLRRLQSGGPPAVDVLAPMIPATILDSVVALAGVASTDTVRYVFVPSGHGVADAFVVTSSETIALRSGVPRQWPHAVDLFVNVQMNNRGGFLILTDPARGTDTVYRALSGREFLALQTTLSQVYRDTPVAGEDPPSS